MTTPSNPSSGPASGGRSEHALIALLERSRPALRALFRSHGVKPDDAEDLLQEALLVMLRRWDSITEPESFLLGTVRLQVLLFFRRKKSEKWVRVEAARLDAMGSAGGGCPQLAVESRQDVRKLLSHLPDRDGRIVEMRYGEQMTSQEVALALQCSDSGVRQAAGRGLRRLRRYAQTLRFKV